MKDHALIPLPADTAPVDTRCFQFVVPLDSQWLGMFFGALYQLTAWNSYDRDEAHTAKDIADRWKTIISAARDSTCGGAMTITFRQTACLLEYSLDSGATWTTAYDGSLCIAAKIADGTILGGSAIDDAIAAGKLSPGNQQAPTPAPALGFCKDFYVTLSANQKWICPTPIAGSYTITVEAAQGGWTDGVVAGPWFCPQGTHYLLGQCEAINVPSEAGDPLSTANHMRLVGNFNSTWFDMYNTTYVVPIGTAETQLFLQANDGTLADNLGSITFHITICRATWTHVFNFLTGEQGWAGLPSGPFIRAAYVSGQGWHHNYPTGDYCDRTTIYINTPGSFNTVFTYIKVTVNTCDGIGSIGIVYGAIGPYVACSSNMGEYTSQQTGNQVTIDLVQACAPYDPFITQVEVRGLGVDPWA